MIQLKRELRAKVRSLIREKKCDHIRIIILESDEANVQVVMDIIQQSSSQLMVNNRYQYNTVTDDYIVRECEIENSEVLIEPVFDDKCFQ